MPTTSPSPPTRTTCRPPSPSPRRAKAAVSGGAGEALERAVIASGFALNHRKVRLQTARSAPERHGLERQRPANVARRRIRRIRAMLHAWEKFGIENAASDHYLKHRGWRSRRSSRDRAYRNVVYGQLSFVKMVRGPEDPVFLKHAREGAAARSQPVALPAPDGVRRRRLRRLHQPCQRRQGRDRAADLRSVRQARPQGLPRRSAYRLGPELHPEDQHCAGLRANRARRSCRTPRSSRNGR